MKRIANFIHNIMAFIGYLYVFYMVITNDIKTLIANIRHIIHEVMIYLINSTY